MYGCSSTLTPISMTPTLITAPIANSIYSLACNVGMIPVGIIPVNNATSYTWFSDATGTTTLQTGTSLDYMQTINNVGGSYTVYVQTNQNGCTSSSLTPITVSVTTSPITLISSISPNDTVCPNLPVTFSLNPSGGTGAYSYSWSPFNSSSDITTQTFSTSTSVYVEISSNGCSSIFALPIIIENINAAFSTNPVFGISPLNVDFTNQSTGASSYNWYFGNNEPNSNMYNPNTTYNSPGTYTVQLIASAFNDFCSDTAYAIIVVENGINLDSIPNVFTPNGDGVNDVFKLNPKGMKNIELEIFNRWGQVLYTFSGINAAWDGRNTFGEKVPDGTYFFFVRATGFDDKVFEKKGTVNLFR
jgi:gliding motility-associated-like protein